MQPKFLTKEERAAEAIKRRQEQVDAQRRIIDDERKKQDEFMRAAKESVGQNVYKSVLVVIVCIYLGFIIWFTAKCWFTAK